MKKLITICILVVTLLVGGMTVEAQHKITIPKTKAITSTSKTQKKSKARTAQTSTAQWNGDIPSAAVLYSMFTNDSKYDNQFKNHGYSIIYQSFKEWNKPGVCEIRISGGSGGSTICIVINDSQKRNWLYNNIKKYISSLKLKHYERVDMSGDEIIFYSYQ